MAEEEAISLEEEETPPLAEELIPKTPSRLLWERHHHSNYAIGFFCYCPYDITWRETCG